MYIHYYLSNTNTEYLDIMIIKTEFNKYIQGMCGIMPIA